MGTVKLCQESAWPKKPHLIGESFSVAYTLADNSLLGAEFNNTVLSDFGKEHLLLPSA